MEKMKKLANCTMHSQIALAEQYREFGYEVVGEPLLREVHGMEDAVTAAYEAVMEAKNAFVDGILLGGRTDLVIYSAILAAEHNLEVYIAETQRIRDENDRFVFQLVGVTPVSLFSFTDGYFGTGTQIGDVWSELQTQGKVGHIKYRPEVSFLGGGAGIILPGHNGRDEVPTSVCGSCEKLTVSYHFTWNGNGWDITTHCSACGDIEEVTSSLTEVNARLDKFRKRGGGN